MKSKPSGKGKSKVADEEATKVEKSKEKKDHASKKKQSKRDKNGPENEEETKNPYQRYASCVSLNAE